MSYDDFNEYWRNAGSNGSQVVRSRAQSFRYSSYIAILILVVLRDYKIAFTVINFAVCGSCIALASEEYIRTEKAFVKAQRISLKLPAFKVDLAGKIRRLSP